MTQNDKIELGRMFVKWKINQFLAGFFKEMRGLRNEDEEWYEEAVRKFKWFRYFAKEYEIDKKGTEIFAKPPDDPQRPPQNMCN